MAKYIETLIKSIILEDLSLSSVHSLHFKAFVRGAISSTTLEVSDEEIDNASIFLP